MSNVQITEINGMKIYNLTGGKSFYDLMKESHFSMKKLKKNEEYINHIEILQDCEFPVSSECVKLSNDGNYLFASGIYPPRLKIFDLNEMSLKCERGLDSQIRKIEIISDDYKKCAMLCEDRNIEIHAQYGRHFKIRIPKYGRELKYDGIYCDLFSCGSSNEIYRLNLNKGQFLESFECKINGINSLAINEPLEILGCACEQGVVELFDLRARNKIFTFDDYFDNDLHSIAFSEDGLNMAVGDSTGKISVFDVRNTKPLFNINHSYHFPIKKILFDEASKNIITVDKKLAKFSNFKTGKNFTNIEPKYEINDFELYKNSGMFFFGCESEKIEIFFIPQLGHAPKWASFLENITEELEEAKTYSLYEDYKFLTTKELEEIGGKELIGTKMLKAYMHGYFMDWKLYKKLKQLTEPFSYDKYLQDKKDQKLQKYFGERIVFNKGEKPKINKQLLDAKLKDEDGKNKKKFVDFKDERFSKIFNDKNFEIDFNSDKFKKNNNNLEIDNQDDKEEIIEKLNEIEVKKEKNINKNNNDSIVNKELFKLNEKLLDKKRKRVEKMYSGFHKEDDDIDFKDRINKKRDDDDISDQEYEIMNKIKKLKNIKSKQQKKQNEDISRNELIKGKRLVGNLNKLNKIKFK